MKLVAVPSMNFEERQDEIQFIILHATDTKTLEETFDYLVIPDVCLKQDEEVFLDNITLQEFQKKVNKPVIVTDGSGQSFYDAFTLGKQIRIIK